MTTNLFRAGPEGDRLKSDLQVTYEPNASGLELELRSVFEGNSGKAIEDQVQKLVKALNVTTGKLSVTYGGAPPFVVDARVETVLRRAGATGDRAPTGATPATSSSPIDHPRPCPLYLPGSEPRFMMHAEAHTKHGIVLDLEDSVHVDEKDSARLLVRNALGSLNLKRGERMVRINTLPLGLEDLDEILPQAPDVILLPKAETAEEVEVIDEAISHITGDESPVWILPVIETALGVEQALVLATASERVCGLALGLEDYTADLGVTKTKEGAETFYARTRVVNAARAVGLQAIDSVYSDIDDLDGLTEWARRSRGLGFEGMGCIHPKQLPVIQEAFAPSQEEVAKARKVVDAFAKAQAEGKGVASVGRQMIDPPVAARAQRVLNRAKELGAQEHA